MFKGIVCVFVYNIFVYMATCSDLSCIVDLCHITNPGFQSTGFLCFILQTITTRLKRTLPDNLSEALSDGVLLCHLANQIRPRSVASVHVPSPAVVSCTCIVSYIYLYYHLRVV